MNHFSNYESRRCPSGATLLEVILVMPILLLLIMAAVEFGLLQSNRQHLEMASRVGAQVASESSGDLLASVDGGAVPAAIVTAINNQLNSAGLPAADDITVAHNVGGVKTLRSAAGTDCPDPTGLPAVPTTGEYVRVTVCIDTTDLTPNLMQFGFDLTGRITQQTTTRRVE